MKKQILLTILMLAAGSMSAQTFSQGEDPKVIEMRQKIGIDYTVPDYDVKKPDAKVMGWRLAKMLQKLEQNYQQGMYNRMLASIRSEILEEPRIRYIAVNKMKILKIQKVGDVITIRISTSSKNEPLGKLNHEFDIRFDKGVSDNDTANQLLSDLNRYIKEDE
jgi:hypothetical protein